MITPVELVHEIEKLSPIERVRIIDIVIKDIIHPDPDIDKVWAREALSRWDAYKNGDVKPISYKTIESLVEYRYSEKDKIVFKKSFKLTQL